MKTYTLQAKTDHNGIIRVELPTGNADTMYEVVLVLQSEKRNVQDKTDWLAFIEETAGSLSDDPIERPPQGDYEVRDVIE